MNLLDETYLQYLGEKDMIAGKYKLQWKVDITDGTSCGFAAPTRNYKGPEYVLKKVA